ncbi:MAG: sigma-70 family RNA polymerase sigma factor [Terriglobales bacterium]
MSSASKPPSFVSSAEAALIDRVLAGDRACFYQLIQPHERAVFLAAMSVCRNEADAEEIAQEAMLRALAALATFRRQSKVSTWLIQITINEARMRFRKDRKHLYESTDAPGSPHDSSANLDYTPKDYADWREIPSEALARKELREALARALASLAPMYREVFILRDVQDLSIAETAAALDLPPATVKTRLLRARLQMRDALAPGLDGAWSLGETAWRKTRPWGPPPEGWKRK